MAPALGKIDKTRITKNMNGWQLRPDGKDAFIKFKKSEKSIKRSDIVVLKVMIYYFFTIFLGINVSHFNEVEVASFVSQ